VQFPSSVRCEVPSAIPVMMMSSALPTVILCDVSKVTFRLQRQVLSSVPCEIPSAVPSMMSTALPTLFQVMFQWRCRLTFRLQVLHRQSSLRYHQCSSQFNAYSNTKQCSLWITFCFYSCDDVVSATICYSKWCFKGDIPTATPSFEQFPCVVPSAVP
jgi:hypothetical protein